MTVVTASAAGLAAELSAAGYLTRDWEQAWSRVDREMFVPDRVWVPEPGGYRRLDRAEEPGRWRSLVHTDVHLVTQVAEGAEAAFALHPTSSASMPRMVAGMLAHLDVREGHRVLEIGTGAGITAALLSERLGDASVVSVELDPVVATQARSALARAGYHPTLVVGDGTAGVAGEAPYDRVLSTCAVRTVPIAWLEQTRPGGRIVTPFGTAFHNGVLLALEVTASAEDGRPVACGPVVGDAAFMWERGQGLTPSVMAAVHDEDQAVDATVRWDPQLVLDDLDAAFAVGLLVPGMRRTVGTPESPATAGEFTLWLVDEDSGSWACVDYTPGRDVFDAARHGPRDLLSATEQALAWWVAAGRPARTRFGLTADTDGQRAWLDLPNRTITSDQLPAPGTTDPGDGRTDAV